MTEWKWSQTTYKAKPKAFRVVRGVPHTLETQVNQLIEEGFVLLGPMYEWVPPGTSNKIFVQAMVLYEEAKDNV